ncbi:hypothetical protein [Aurantimicrobium minutum]|uniref:hypothetical protein n=1 Tax=Aurantimicrobium minutum TaxID=708131 RepID=UPI0024738DC4|nr:hypothetical protein [Aurantimicrobium minutum]MDH6207112.1 hypothetical protein [Aurantimicrobium minutum]
MTETTRFDLVVPENSFSAFSDAVVTTWAVVNGGWLRILADSVSNLDNDADIRDGLNSCNEI